MWPKSTAKSLNKGCVVMHGVFLPLQKSQQTISTGGTCAHPLACCLDFPCTSTALRLDRQIVSSFALQWDGVLDSMAAALSVDEAKELISEMCRNFYGQGWVSGTGGGMSIKAGDGIIVMAPSGVQKERMEPEDMFVLDAAGEVLETPRARPPPSKAPKLSECSPLFMAVRLSCLLGALYVWHAWLV